MQNKLLNFFRQSPAAEPTQEIAQNAPTGPLPEPTVEYSNEIKAAARKLGNIDRNTYLKAVEANLSNMYVWIGSATKFAGLDLTKLITSQDSEFNQAYQIMEECQRTRHGNMISATDLLASGHARRLGNVVYIKEVKTFVPVTPDLDPTVINFILVKLQEVLLPYTEAPGYVLFNTQLPTLMAVTPEVYKRRSAGVYVPSKCMIMLCPAQANNDYHTLLHELSHMLDHLKAVDVLVSRGLDYTNYHLIDAVTGNTFSPETRNQWTWKDSATEAQAEISSNLHENIPNIVQFIISIDPEGNFLRIYDENPEEFRYWIAGEAPKGIEDYDEDEEYYHPGADDTIPSRIRHYLLHLSSKLVSPETVEPVLKRLIPSFAMELVPEVRRATKEGSTTDIDANISNTLIRLMRSGLPSTEKAKKFAVLVESRVESPLWSAFTQTLRQDTTLGKLVSDSMVKHIAANIKVYNTVPADFIATLDQYPAIRKKLCNAYARASLKSYKTYSNSAVQLFGNDEDRIISNMRMSENSCMGTILVLCKSDLPLRLIKEMLPIIREHLDGLAGLVKIYGPAAINKSLAMRIKLYYSQDIINEYNQSQTNISKLVLADPNNTDMIDHERELHNNYKLLIDALGITYV